ncbi:prefoldin subunit beta [Candidatus Woesearchaeota archaeon]|nr:prefoldin subunit beta [Candidatus Woesearchaeota archaeon]
MTIPKDVEEKIQQLQLLEQNLQNFIIQKQTLQMQLVELENAITELEKTETAFKIIGNIMVKVSKDELKKDLESRKEVSALRANTIEKQEILIRERASKLQKEVLGEMKEQ